MLAYDIDWAVTAQMLTAIAAIAALFLGPLFSLKIARQAMVAQSRQQWLDGLRDDVAQILGCHGQFVLSGTLSELDPKNHDAEKIQMLFSRIRLRLNVEEPEHKHLMDVLEAYVTNFDNKSELFTGHRVYEALDPIKKGVWRDIKAGRT